MNRDHDNTPHLDSSTVQQWVRQYAQQKQTVPIPEKEKTEEDIRKNRMEWIDLAATAFCLVLSVLLILLFLSSVAALFTSMNTGYISHLNYLQFILPCVLTTAFFLILNSILKRKRNRYLALLIMIIWLPFYIPAFVTLLNVSLPPLHIKETSSKLYGTNYHGDENYTVLVRVDEVDAVLEFKLPKDIYDRVSYDSTAEVTIRKGFLGIDYANVKLDHLENQIPPENK